MMGMTSAGPEGAAFRVKKRLLLLGEPPRTESREGEPPFLGSESDLGDGEAMKKP